MLFSIRHGQSEVNANRANFLKDNCDMIAPLTDLGVEQVTKSANWLVKQDFNPNPIIILFSPYTRTYQTANIIAEALKKRAIKVRMGEEFLLSERQFGYIQHPSFTDNSWNEIQARMKRDNCSFYARPPGGESPYDVAVRIRPFVEKMRRMLGDNVILVSHGDTLRIMNMFYNGDPISSYQNTPIISNAGITIYDAFGCSEVFKP